MTNEELSNLRNTLKTQNNRITAEPLFIVEQEEVIWGMDEAHTESYMFEWVNNDDPEDCWDDGDIREHIIETDDTDTYRMHDEDDVDPEQAGFHRVFYTKRWRFVTAHFTESAADQYLHRNRHNLNNPRVYVTSQYRCHEWNMVREHLMADPTPTDAGPWETFDAWWKEHQQEFLEQGTAKSCAAIVWQAARMA